MDRHQLTKLPSAQWLRDTGNQFAHLYKLLPHDKNLQALVKAVINTEARYISQYPYCGAFHYTTWYKGMHLINDIACRLVSATT